MKLQHLIVIFVIIILPITFIMSVYIQSQVDTILLQSTYSSKLLDATYDSVKAFQLNTINNRYSSVSDSKIRDIEAAINSFYSSLSASLNISEDNLKQFTPAILVTMYDGYYIYGKRENTESNEYEYGLKPYVYYSARYKKGNTDCQITYTLDNAITVYGTVNGKKVEPQTGFLINTSDFDLDTQMKINNGKENEITSIEYDGITIGTEKLQETLLILKDATATEPAKVEKQTYPYTFYDNRKVYQESENVYFWYSDFRKMYVKDAATKNTEPAKVEKQTYPYTFYDNRKVYQESENVYFWYSDFRKMYVKDAATKKYAKATINANRSALEYYISAYKFSNWIKNNLKDLTMKDAYDKNGNPIKFETNQTGDDKIFDFNDTTNHPEHSESTFNTHRMAVIRNSIEGNLLAAIANYNQFINTNYDYRMPKIKDIDWEKITNEMSMTTFLQGIPIKNKFFSSYCTISNNQNKEFVSKSSIIFLGSDGNYHKPNCKHIVDKKVNIVGAYTNLSIERQTVKVSESEIYYFYPQQRENNLPYLNCYDCIVNIANIYDLNQLIDGSIKQDNMVDGNEIEIYNKNNLKEVRNIYFRTMAREKYNLYGTKLNFAPNQ